MVSKVYMIRFFFLVSFLSLIIASQYAHGFLFDDDFVDKETGRDDRITAREKFSQDDVEEASIDLEEDLLFSEIKDIATIMTLAFAVVIIISLIAAVKMVSAYAIVIGLGLALIAAAVAGGIYAVESTMVMQLITQDDTEHWRGMEASSIDLSNLDDLGDPEVMTSEGSHLVDRMMLNARMGDDIIKNSTLHRWATGHYKREAYVIEFINDIAAYSFRDLFFEPIRTVDVRRYTAEFGVVQSSMDYYDRGFLMHEDRFIILVFGSEMHSLHAMNSILHHFPERYWIDDDTEPELHVLTPDGETDENILRIRFSDIGSGVNPMSLRITNLEKDIDPMRGCRQRSGKDYDSYECTFNDVLKEGVNSITVIISDNELNNVKKNIEYELI